MHVLMNTKLTLFKQTLKALKIHHLHTLILLGGVAASSVAQVSNYDPPPIEDVDAWIEYHEMPIFLRCSR